MNRSLVVFRGIGNKQAAPNEKARVNENNSGKGLEYDVVKAMVGMVNSNHNVGRVWVGAKDPNCMSPVEVYIDHERSTQSHTPNTLRWCLLGFIVRGWSFGSFVWT